MCNSLVETAFLFLVISATVPYNTSALTGLATIHLNMIYVSIISLGGNPRVSASVCI